MLPDDELIMMSALQHYAFCPRQCALIHVEDVWRDNYFTSSGNVLHEKVHSKTAETRRDVKQLTSLRLISRRLGVMGVADMVELHRRADGWHAYPVEYKRGRPMANRADEIQLCAQAMALEEMRHEQIPEGALFYGATRRRMAVNFDDELRDLTMQTAQAVREMIAAGRTPPARYSPACEACSLIDICHPKTMDGGRSARQWLDSRLDREGS